MAQGENAKKVGHAGREYWSRRFSGWSWGKFGKFLTHRRERRQTKRLERTAKVGPSPAP